MRTEGRSSSTRAEDRARSRSQKLLPHHHTIHPSVLPHSLPPLQQRITAISPRTDCVAHSLLVKLLVMSNAASASPDSKEAVGGAAAGGGQQNEVTSVPDLVVTSDAAGDDNAVIGCTDDDAKETETDADVEVVAAAADNKTADAAPNAEER